VSAILVLFLVGPPDADGRERKAAAAIDCGTGEFVAIERYLTGSPQEAVRILQDREKWGWGRIVYGPAIKVPARQLYDLTDMIRGLPPGRKGVA